MADRVNTITVVLEEPTSQEFADKIAESICMIKGVLTAKTDVMDYNVFIVEERVKSSWKRKLFDILK